MRIERLDHLVLTVADLDRTVAFYRDVLGMRPVTSAGGRLALAYGRQKINLHLAEHEVEPCAHRSTPGSADLCFIAAGGLEGVLDDLARAGVPVETGPVDRTGATGPLRSVYVRDPDANLVEISEPASAGPDRLELVRWQHGFAWSLAEVHLPALTDPMCLWSPAPGAWTVRRGTDGRWRPDWVEPEPDPAPAVSVGWLTWHLLWWWSELVGRATGEPVPAREDVDWPGTAADTVRRLRDLHERWERVLADTDEEAADRPFGYPWPRPRPFLAAAAWANQELMKNVAEIGAGRHLYAAHVPGMPEARSPRGPGLRDAP